MIDIRKAKENIEQTEKKLRSKGEEFSIYPALELYDKLCLLKTETQEAEAKMNAASKAIGQKKQQGLDAQEEIQSLAQLKKFITQRNEEIKQLEVSFEDLLARLPNLPTDDIKISPNKEDNVCIKKWGEKPSFSFPLKNHVQLNELHHLFDFKRASKLSGSNWPLYRNLGARIEWALIQFMLNVHLENGYTFWMPPLLVSDKMMFASGQLPKFKDQAFKLTDEDYNMYLIPTAEVCLNGVHTDEILEEDQLPLRYVSYTPCFRRESGALGAQERGLIRMHQFNKVEMFAFTTPEQSESMFEEMCKTAESILEKLELHYRSMLLVTSDMSFAAAKTVDIEVYLPGQERYYEVSSISNCTDYQARRGKTRFRSKQDKKAHLVHTLNGSGLATSRLMVALLENNQQEDGSIKIPKALQPYLGGLEVLHPETATTSTL